MYSADPRQSRYLFKGSEDEGLATIRGAALAERLKMRPATRPRLPHHHHKGLQRRAVGCGGQLPVEVRRSRGPVDTYPGTLTVSVLVEDLHMIENTSPIANQATRRNIMSACV